MTPETLKITKVVAAYWFISISMVYLNKLLMSSENVSLDAPLFVTWYQCVITCFICYICGVLGERFGDNAKTADKYASVQSEEDGTPSKPPSTQISPALVQFFSQFPKTSYNVNTARSVLPLSIVFVGMITFNNLCLKWVEVSFYNVARSLTIVFNVGLTFFLLGDKSSQNTLGCLCVVIVGFLVGSGGEVNFSMKGTTAGILSSLFVSLNSIFTKKILPTVQDNHWRLTWYNNANAVMLFLPLILIFESSAIYNAIGQQLADPIFWSAMTVAGAFGFSIGIITVLQIKVTSPLSHNISGTAKAALQSIMAFYIWGNQPTFFGIMGIGMVLGGSLLYTYVKMGERRDMVNATLPQRS